MDLHQQKVLLNSIRNLNEEREFVYWEKRFETEMYKRGHAYAVQILEGIENNNPEALQLRDTFLETVGVNLAEYNVFDAARRGARAGGDVAKTVGLRGGVTKFFALDAPFKLAGAAAGAAHHLLGGSRPEDAAEKHIQTQRAGYHPDVEPHEGPWSSHPHAPTINVNVSPTMTNVGGNTNVTTGDTNVGNAIRASATTIRRINNSNRRGVVAIPGKPEKETTEPGGEETPTKPPVREPESPKPSPEPTPPKPSPEPTPPKPSPEPTPPKPGDDIVPRPPKPINPYPVEPVPGKPAPGLPPVRPRPAPGLPLPSVPGEKPAPGLPAPGLPGPFHRDPADQPQLPPGRDKPQLPPGRDLLQLPPGRDQSHPMLNQSIQGHLWKDWDEPKADLTKAANQANQEGKFDLESKLRERRAKLGEFSPGQSWHMRAMTAASRGKGPYAPGGELHGTKPPKNKTQPKPETSIVRTTDPNQMTFGF